MQALKIFVYLKNYSWALVVGNVWARGRMVEDEDGEVDRA